MNYDNFRKFTIRNRENELWERCTFVFDTSTLLDFYLYSTNAQNDIFEKIFIELEGRLWIPGHVEYEFFKNREKVIKELINKKYKKETNNKFSTIENRLIKISCNIDELFKFVKENDKRPNIDESIIQGFKEKTIQFEDDFKLFKEQFNDKLDEQIEELKSLQNHENDSVLQQIVSHFDTGQEYSYEKIIKVMNEGEFRYRNTLPPGYEDLKDDNKNGMQIYGDLIIWKQIIDYAKQKEECASIVLVINDAKEDWCFKDKKRGRIIAPRDELILELYKETGSDFWMYTLSQFLYKAKELLDTEVADKTIEEVKSIEEKKVDQDLRIREILAQQKIYKRLESKFHSSIMIWLMNNYNLDNIEYLPFPNKHIDFVFNDGEKNVAIIIEEIGEDDVKYNEINNILDFLYRQNRLNSIGHYILFLVTKNKELDIYIDPKKSKQYYKLGFEIITGYIGEDNLFHRTKY